MCQDVWPQGLEAAVSGRSRASFGSPAVLLSAVGLLALSGLAAEEPGVGEEPAGFRSPADRLDDLERRVAELQDELERARREAKKEPEEDLFAQGLELLGGTTLKLGGQVEFRFIDSESDRFAPLGAAGSTEEPDPHLEIQQLRLEPEIELNRWISVRAQVDLEPRRGRTFMREIVARHDAQPVWWFDSRFQIGLDDRFIRPQRRTETYPLLGNAFWRDESAAFTWRLRFGDRNGRPAAGRGAGARGLWAEAFDFPANWGEVNLYLSLGQGYVMNTNEVGFDQTAFNGLVQDDRELGQDLALRELGVGLEYRRDFAKLGELSGMVFYYNDELRDVSLDFLSSAEMTVREVADPTLIRAGYGDSNERLSERYGASVEYFLPASTLLGGILDTRRGDGVRLFAQYIQAEDGELDRHGWYVQGSWRLSFGRLLMDRYFRSVEPVVRYGVFDVSVPFGTSPVLPGTWDRTELLVGAIVEVTGDIVLKAEYTFHDEDTGGGSVDNDELLVELLLTF